jgi:HEPN domain-containing protein
MMRTRDWFGQAEKDLQHAKASVDSRDFEWACFAAHQAGEKTVKALYQSVHIDSISRMMQNPPAALRPSAEIVDRAKELDKHYIPSRYPNSHPEGAPPDYYTEQDARKAVEGAERIIGFCRSTIPEDQRR